MSVMTELAGGLLRAGQRIRAEYQEMPCLSLTAPQTARLLGLAPSVAAAALNALEDLEFLVRTRDGRFLRRDRCTIAQGRLWSGPTRSMLPGAV